MQLDLKEEEKVRLRAGFKNLKSPFYDSEFKLFEKKREFRFYPRS